ncbi:MAG: hypothetical protein PHY14_04740 [Candidatus Gracilibacteria bacterium]|nr:hypothetical protein [Candidatus Gracilibacteria bacterium]
MRTIFISLLFISLLSSCTKSVDTPNSSTKSPQTVTATVVDMPAPVSQSPDSGAVMTPSVQ